MHPLIQRILCLLALLTLQAPVIAAEGPPVDDPTGVDVRQAAEAFEIPAIRVDFPIKAGMTVEQIDAFVEAQESLAREIDLEKEYSFGWNKRDIERGNGWLYYWVNGKRLLHCDIVIRNGKAQSVWVMPGNDKWTAMVFFPAVWGRSP